MKKFISLLSVLLIFLILIFGFIYLAKWMFPSGQTPSDQELTYVDPTTSQIPGTTDHEKAPTGEKLEIGTKSGTVTINNFYSAKPDLNDSGVYLLRENNDYAISYDPSGGSFFIQVARKDQAIISKAEQDLLSILGIDQATACKLDVSVGTPYGVDPEMAAHPVNLSFCF